MSFDQMPERYLHDECRVEIKRLQDALTEVKAAIGDRLLAEGPLDKKYANKIMRQIEEALNG